MSVHSRLTIRDVHFEAWKEGFSDEIMMLFSESEKHVEQMAPSPEEELGESEEDTSPPLSVEYVSSVEAIKKRLDFLGFTFDTCREVFELARCAEIIEGRKRVEELKRRTFDSGSRSDWFTEKLQERIELLVCSNAESWLAAVREALLAPPDADPSQLSDLANSFKPMGTFLTGLRFPNIDDERFRLRFELEALQTGQVILDVSELVDAGDYPASYPLSELARESVCARDKEALHLIILTEGATDKFVLEGALRVLQPELNEYISFMDFSAFNVEGGASFLASIVRAFAGAGIRDRIVAVFDNDTAGCLSQSLLMRHDLPNNIRVLRYPDIELAQNYPTLGPSGLVQMDVNGSAGGIELYLGSDVLSDSEGTLIPIQWKGFEGALKRYQGEIVDKRGCLKRFSDKLAEFDRNGGDPNSPCWGELRAIMDMICSAFNASNAASLIDLARSSVGGDAA